MTIDEAVKLLKEMNKGCSNKFGNEIQKYKDALKLGIEALERTQHLRLYNPPSHSYYLPGESVSRVRPIEF